MSHPADVPSEAQDTHSTTLGRPQAIHYPARLYELSWFIHVLNQTSYGQRVESLT